MAVESAFTFHGNYFIVTPRDINSFERSLKTIIVNWLFLAIMMDTVTMDFMFEEAFFIRLFFQASKKIPKRLIEGEKNER